MYELFKEEYVQNIHIGLDICQFESTILYEQVNSMMSRGYLSPGLGLFYPQSGDFLPQAKKGLVVIRYLPQKTITKNTKKPTGEQKITILIFVTFFSLGKFIFFPLVRQLFSNHPNI